MIFYPVRIPRTWPWLCARCTDATGSMNLYSALEATRALFIRGIPRFAVLGVGLRATADRKGTSTEARWCRAMGLRVEPGSWLRDEGGPGLEESESELRFSPHRISAVPTFSPRDPRPQAKGQIGLCEAKNATLALETSRKPTSLLSSLAIMCRYKLFPRFCVEMRPCSSSLFTVVGVVVVDDRRFCSFGK
ncbi:hypothetical protein MPTK1_3g06500 [Marchantia polymorpha subsp. ruderalis]|uniref:Uncharacterized protein n=2 Tax=Marchantia polymorpha TaxID=3197 RepID=A0AAF6AY18_MARPO|nr:hypothetical protein MARPO_0006s0119 [Marchantia polymorpha]BBN04652.1 hypothetical protein Mp_3g06500 [Marchantia polymorpha subsp. ruderalis]|eukprot:PTQ48088.1 hypothetical protein MARPO_0006s0119 [Marchantia polymorpha]